MLYTLGDLSHASIFEAWHDAKSAASSRSIPSAESRARKEQNTIEV
jgi:hypothetical protein